MYYAGVQMPSRTEIRQLYANTAAEKKAAASVEKQPEARAVVDAVNIVYDNVRRLDETSVDASEGRGTVEFEAAPKKRNGFQKAIGWGETPVESIAMEASKKNDIAQISGTMDGAEMDVSVSFEDGRAPLIYSKTVAKNGEVFFQKGNELVGMDTNGLLTFVTL